VGYLNATTTFATQINSGSNVFYTWDYGNGLTETIPPLQPGLLVYTSTAGSVYTVTDSFTATVVASNTVSVMTATVTVQIFAGDLAIEHTSETAVLRPGDWVTYTLVYQNNGDLPVTDIRLHNFYPPELLNTQVTASGAITQSTDAPYVYFLPPLAVGESGVLTVTGQASPAITTTTWFTHGAYIAGNVGDGLPDNNFSQLPAVVVLGDAPLALAGVSAAAVAENEPAQLSGLIVNLDPADTYTLTIDWGDGLTNTYPYPAGTLLFTETHLYLDNPTPQESYTVTLHLEDDDVMSAVSQIGILVANGAPVLIDLTLPAAINEGDTAVLSAQIIDPSPLDSFEVVIEWGDGLSDTLSYPAGTTVFTTSHLYLDDEPGNLDDIYSLLVTVADDDSGSFTYTNTLQVANLPPLVAAGGDQVVRTNETVTLSGSFSDPGTLDSHTIVWDLGDGTVITGSLTVTHVYEVAGSYTAVLTVYDDDGGVGSDTVLIEVEGLYELFLPVIQRSNGPLSNMDAAAMDAAAMDAGGGKGMVSKAVRPNGWVSVRPAAGIVPAAGNLPSGNKVGKQFT
jgi:uncharacterized repeat protein (TIGR01451 family)